METERPTRAARFGKGAGRLWRKYVRREAAAIYWFEGKGIPRYVSNTLAWTIRLSLLLVILLLVGSLVAIFAIVYVSAKCRDDSEETVEWAIGEQNDHKKNPFYDPINFTDADDPRFDD
jgi:hypothetical protein